MKDNTNIILRGLPGLNRLSEEERQKWFADNEEKLKKYAHLPQSEYMKAANYIYDGQKFIDIFGNDAYNKTRNLGANAQDYRNKMLTDKITEDAFAYNYSPFADDGTRDNSKGLGAEYEKYFGYVDPTTGQRMGGMSSEALMKVLDSGYKSPEEFEEYWDKRNEEMARKAELQSNSGAGAFMPTGASLAAPILSTTTGKKLTDTLAAIGSEEGAKKDLKDSNNRILERIYGEEAETRAAELGEHVGQAYNDASIVGRTDEETVNLFKKAITPDASSGNLGISEYASHYGIVEGEKIAPEMENFSIDEMRQVLAKKAVYDSFMTPDMAATALNNEAKRYINARQGAGRKVELFAKDVAIASASYTVDKANGFYNLGLMAADAIADKPIVYIDDSNNVLPLDDERITNNEKGVVGYYGEDGGFHPVHKEEIDRKTLHNMGKNVGVFGTAGSEDDSLFNPHDWTIREMTGVWDKDTAKQYQKLGSSAYKVVYDPNDDRDLLYESFKMMSFGLADMGAQLIPFGMGALGKAASTAKYIGRLGRDLGKATAWTSNILAKPGLQGLAGALGIAEAYQRGAFEETLAQNLTNLQDVAYTESRNEIYNAYNNDPEYRKQLDAEISNTAAALKSQYIASLGEDAKDNILDEEVLDKMMMAKAQDEVLQNKVKEKIEDNISTGKYADKQAEAIRSAGLAATNSFWPEALKYAYVNTLGYRKFLFSNPTSVLQKAQNTFKGMREIVTKEGKLRLVTDLAKDLTRKEKLLSTGKFIGQQAWGGAWTNGTDDMMVDAAERINEDSFNRHLHDYKTGESTADTYGLMDGLYSYWMGLQNSLGQESTRDAAIVGAGGSLITGNLHFTNIASLATKSGREAFKRNFFQRYKFDNRGMPERDAEGKIITEDLDMKDWRNWKNNAGDLLGFFVQNGVLNNYYGRRQQLRDLQQHANEINDLLDHNEDFSIIEDMVASDIASDNADNIGDKKTTRFITAFNAMMALDGLANSEKDPTTMSSVIRDRKALIDRASVLGTDKQHDFSRDELNSLIAQYYSNNTGLPQTEENNQIAIQNIGKNARTLKTAYQEYLTALGQFNNTERSLGYRIAPPVKLQMLLELALDHHWEDRIETMKKEIGDSSDGMSPNDETLVAVYGGKKNAEKAIKAYDEEEVSLTSKIAEVINEEQKRLEVYNEAQKAMRNATTSDEIYHARTKLTKAKSEYENALENKMFYDDILTALRNKRSTLQNAINALGEENSRALTEDEIMGLDPINRAMVMDSRNRSLYSAEQKKNIENLEGRLKKDYGESGDPLQKIQDIAKLTKNRFQNQDAYNRITRNPDAAAVQLEQQKEKIAAQAYDEINRRNANILADYIDQMMDALVGRDDVSQYAKEDYVYKTLRNKNPILLNNILSEGRLPGFKKQVEDALEWAKVTEDINNIIEKSSNSDEWKETVSKNIDAVISTANNREEIMGNLERAVETYPEFEDVLNDLVMFGYHRNTTVIESRKQKKEREEAIAVREEEIRKAAEEAARIAAEKAEAAAKETAEKDMSSEGTDNAIEKALSDESKEVDLGESTESKESTKVTQSASTEKKEGAINKPSYFSSMKSQIGNKKSKWDYYTSSEKETRTTKEGTFILGTSWNGTVQPSINLAIDSGILDYKTYGVIREIKPTGTNAIAGRDKAIEAFKKLEELDIKTPAELIKYIEDHEGEPVTKPINESEGAKLEGQVKSSESPSLVVQNAEGNTEGKSLDFKEQLNEINDDADVTIVTDSEDGEVESKNAIEKAKAAPSRLTANPFVRFIILPERTSKGDWKFGGDGRSLFEDRILILKKGEKPVTEESEGDTMSRYYKWMDEHGIKFQNIIDDEFTELIAKNPHTKLKFMTVRPTVNAVTHDNYMTGDNGPHILLVTDYDESINPGITKIHHDSNGGVVTSKGKRYLIVGTVGYGDKNTALTNGRFELWKNLNDTNEGHRIAVKAWSWFNSEGNKEERFYVYPGASTEVYKNSIINGFLANHTENDEGPTSRRISELLDNPETNPHGLTWESLAWGLQKLGDFAVVNNNGKPVKAPTDRFDNAGRVFVLVPGGDRNLLAAKIDPLKWGDDKFNKNSELYREIMNLFQKVTSPVYSDRYEAIRDLVQIFYLSSEENGDNILIGNDRNEANSNTITIKKGNQVLYSYDLNDRSEFDFEGGFMKAIEVLKPRVNITLATLADGTNGAKKLKKLDEAGALMTDVLKLGSYGVSYEIYGVDKEGNMIIPADNPPAATNDGNTSPVNGVQVLYKGGELYYYNRETREFSLHNKTIEDPSLIEGLKYALEISDRDLAPSKIDGRYEYYILDDAHNVVVRQSHRDRTISKLSEEDAENFINKVKEEIEAQKREAEINDFLNKQEEQAREAALKSGVETEVDLGEEEVTDKEMNDLLNGTFGEETASEELEEGEETKDNANPEIETATEKPKYNPTSPTVTLSQLWRRDAKRRDKIIDLINKKKESDSEWKGVNTNSLKDINDFLRKKNVPIDIIGTSEEDFNSWMQQLKCS